MLSKWHNRLSRRWLLWLLTELKFHKMLLDFLPMVYKTNCPVRLLLPSFGSLQTKGKSIRVESFEATAGEASPFPPMDLSESMLHSQPRVERPNSGLEASASQQECAEKSPGNLAKMSL